MVSSAAQLHGWNQPAAVDVNIANIPMPTEEERAEMRALDRKLDAFAAMLKRCPADRWRGGNDVSRHHDFAGVAGRSLKVIPRKTAGLHVAFQRSRGTDAPL